MGGGGSGRRRRWEEAAEVVALPLLFVYFLSGVNIHAWLQPSHLHMSTPLSNTTHTHTHTHRE